MAEAFLTENLPEAVFGAPKVNIVVLVSWYILHLPPPPHLIYIPFTNSLCTCSIIPTRVGGGV